MITEHDTTFLSMGCDVRLLIGKPLRVGDPQPEHAALEQRAFIEGFASRFSRFLPGSELSALNGDTRPAVAAGPLLRALVRAGVWAAGHSGGLVDPTLVSEIEAAGYAQSRVGAEPASLEEALAGAPVRRSAQPDARTRWRQIAVDDRAGVVRRPPGVRIDSGGFGKGLVADLVAFQLAGYSRYVVDCGGDLAIGGIESLVRPFEVEVRHPLTRETVARTVVSSGGVATSGLDVRVWRTPDGYAHHLLDPSTGLPAWTGLIGVTALGASALEAETLAKTALLLGPTGARRVLARHGGFAVHDSGDVEPIGPVDRPTPLRLRLPGVYA